MFQHGLFIDNFCGGGGASAGIERAIGRSPDLAINHDASAIAMHTANHPSTEHLCQDIWQAVPIQVTRGQRVAGAWFSPDCKEHSKAKGGPVKDRNIRDLGWTVVYWIEQTMPDVVYLENVEEFRQWGPVDEWTKCVIPERRGETWKRWCAAIRRLGYKLEWRELRACDYGAPTSRKRLYVVARRDGRKIVWPKPTHGAPTSIGVKRGKLLPYRTAAECIDWTIPCPSIFLSHDEARVLGVRRPLKDSTLRRVAHGVMRYVVEAKQPFIVPITHTGDLRVHSAAEPLRTITTANGGEFMAADVTLAPHITKFRSRSIGSDAGDPMPTVTANGEPARPAGATPLGLAGATLVQTNFGERPGQKPRVPHLDKPIGTIMASGVSHAPVTAMLSQIAGTFVETAHGEVGKDGKRRGKGHRDPHAPMPTQTTSNNVAAVSSTLVEASFLDRQFGRSRGAAMDRPAPAIMPGGAGKTAQVSAFLSHFHGSNTNGGNGDPVRPLNAVLAEGEHKAGVCAHMEQANTGAMIGREMTRPVTTITASGSQQRVVETTLLPEDALPPAMMARANMVAAFLVKYYGTAIGQDADKPFHTVTTLPRFAVVTVTIDAVTYVIVDIGLRMLTPRELARAQGFPESYELAPITPQLIRGKIVHKPLTKAAQIRMIGNSVCPDVAAAIVGANQPYLRHDERLAA